MPKTIDARRRPVTASRRAEGGPGRPKGGNLSGEEKRAIRDRLRRVKQELGIASDAALAAELGLGRQTVGNWLTKSVITTEGVLLLNRGLGIDPTWLLTGRGQMQQDQGIAGVRAEIVEELRRELDDVVGPDRLRESAIEEVVPQLGMLKAKLIDAARQDVIERTLAGTRSVRMAGWAGLLELLPMERRPLLNALLAAE